MTLEFLPAGSPDCPLIRLYAFTPDEAATLHAELAALANGGLDRVEVHGLAGVEPVGGCRLTLVAEARDLGIAREDLAGASWCGSISDTWGEVAGRVEPFVKETSGYQWLAGPPGDVSLLLSADGRW